MPLTEGSRCDDEPLDPGLDGVRVTLQGEELLGEQGVGRGVESPEAGRVHPARMPAG